MSTPTNDSVYINNFTNAAYKFSGRHAWAYSRKEYCWVSSKKSEELVKTLPYYRLAGSK